MSNADKDRLLTFVAIVAIGVGLWWERPSFALIAVGAIVVMLAVLGRILGNV